MDDLHYASTVHVYLSSALASAQSPRVTVDAACL